jgi:hypothetical protein
MGSQAEIGERPISAAELKFSKLSRIAPISIEEIRARLFIACFILLIFGFRDRELPLSWFIHALYVR